LRKTISSIFPLCPNGDFTRALNPSQKSPAIFRVAYDNALSHASAGFGFGLKDEDGGPALDVNFYSFPTLHNARRDFRESRGFRGGSDTYKTDLVKRSHDVYTMLARDARQIVGAKDPLNSGARRERDGHRRIDCGKPGTRGGQVAPENAIALNRVARDQRQQYQNRCHRLILFTC
jgi:hypothetical protein